MTETKIISNIVKLAKTFHVSMRVYGQEVLPIELIIA